MNRIRRTNHGTFVIELLVIIYKEDGLFVSYCPGLHLSSYSDTIEQAKEGFHVVLDDFLKYSLERKILADNLVNLGWEFENGENPKILDHFESIALNEIDYSDIGISGQMFTDTHQYSYA